MTVKILGIDPGSVAMGWGIISANGPHVSYIAHGVIRPKQGGTLAQKMGNIANCLTQIITDFRPDCAAMEEAFVAQNLRTALVLGHARGAAMAILAQHGIFSHEYAARLVKKSVVGIGSAEKSQVAFMVRRLLPLAGPVEGDSADALAVALCHSAFMANDPNNKIRAAQ